MIKVNRGDTAVLAVKLYVDNEPFTPAEGQHAVFCVKERIDDNEPVLIRKEVVDNAIHLDHTDTCSLACGIYACDVRIYAEDKSWVFTPIVDELQICEVVNCDLL